MDQRKKNIIKAGVLSFGILIVTVAIWSVTVHQWQLEELDQLRADCQDPCTFTYDPFLPNVLVVVPPLLSLFLLMNYFENKRLRTWRSYH